MVHSEGSPEREVCNNTGLPVKIENFQINNLTLHLQELHHRWQTQGLRPNPDLHLVLSGPAPSSRLTVKEQFHLYSPKMTFGPLKATTRLMWPPVKMSLIPLN